MATRVRKSSGTPSASSSLGSRRGPMSSETNRWTRLVARSDAGTRAKNEIRRRASHGVPAAAATDTGTPRIAEVQSPIEDRYRGVAARNHARRSHWRAGSRYSSSGLEKRAAPGDEVVARVGEAGLEVPHGGGRGLRVVRQAHGRSRHVDLVMGAAPREVLDRVPVPVARREVHSGDARARAERLVDQTDALEEVRPVDGRQQPHAGDDVAHRGMGGDLGLVLGVDDLVGRGALAGEPAVEPVERGRDRGILLAKPLGELHGEGLRERPLLEHLDHGRRFAASERRRCPAARRRRHPRDPARRHARPRPRPVRRRFSTSTRRREIARAQNSPIVSDCTR